MKKYVLAVSIITLCGLQGCGIGYIVDEARGKAKPTGGIQESIPASKTYNRLVALKNQLVRQIKVPHPRANAKQFIIKINSMYS